ncbi:MAG: Rrf2 family transcriptional regulator [Candidatus Buchananbacteria bacterium]
MKFSTRSSYGLRALAHLAKYYGNKPYSLAKVAQEEKISQAYLERLFSRLKKAGILVSSKGMAGGYQLARKPAQISILSVIEALEGTVSVFKCLGVRGDLICSQKSCPSGFVYQKVQKALTDSLSSMTLNDLIKNN